MMTLSPPTPNISPNPFRKKKKKMRKKKEKQTDFGKEKMGERNKGKIFGVKNWKWPPLQIEGRERDRKVICKLDLLSFSEIEKLS